MDVGAALTRKLGPLPAWGWGIGIGGAILAVRVLRGGSIGGRGEDQEAQRILVPTGGSTAAPDFVSELGTRIGELADNIAGIASDVGELQTQTAAPSPTAPNPSNPSAPATPTTAKPKPKMFDLATYVRGLRRVFPAAAKLFPYKEYAGETAAQRKARLDREREFIEAHAGIGDYNLASYVQGLRRLFPTIATQFGERQTAGETAAQRVARLERERKFIESRAGVGNTEFLSFGSSVKGFPLSATAVSGAHGFDA